MSWSLPVRREEQHYYVNMSLPYNSYRLNSRSGLGVAGTLRSGQVRKWNWVTVLVSLVCKMGKQTGYIEIKVNHMKLLKHNMYVLKSPFPIKYCVTHYFIRKKF